MTARQNREMKEIGKETARARGKRVGRLKRRHFEGNKSEKVEMGFGQGWRR